MKLERIVKNSPFYAMIRATKNRFDLIRWKMRGCPSPPPHLVKQELLRLHAKKYNTKVMVETGTYYGDMIRAMLPYFKIIYSIELSEQLHAKAVRRFSGHNKVNILLGDSGVELPKILDELDEPSLFWLDGHYSAGETASAELSSPIFEELKHLVARPNIGHVILIDDARCFVGSGGYPKLEEIKEFFKENWPDYTLSVKTDVIILLPKLPSCP